jgi:sodium transport system permease protein
MTDAVASPFSVGEAVLLCLFAFFGLMLTAALAGGGLVAIGASEVAFLGLPAAFAASRRGGAPAVALVPARARHLAGGVLVGASGWAVLATLVLPLQERLAPTPPALEEALRRTVAPEPLALVAIAVLPAICEELLLRGVVTFALARRLGRVAGVLASALLFALLHGSPYRLAPTFVLGCSFGAIALRSGSIVPTMIAHALNNGALWLMSAFPSLEVGFTARVPLVAAVAVSVWTLGHCLVFLRFSDDR